MSDAVKEANSFIKDIARAILAQYSCPETEEYEETQLQLQLPLAEPEPVESEPAELFVENGHVEAPGEAAEPKPAKRKQLQKLPVDPAVLEALGQLPVEAETLMGYLQQLRSMHDALEPILAEMTTRAARGAYDVPTLCDLAVICRELKNAAVRVMAQSDPRHVYYGRLVATAVLGDDKKDVRKSERIDARLCSASAERYRAAASPRNYGEPFQAVCKALGIPQTVIDWNMVRIHHASFSRFCDSPLATDELKKVVSDFTDIKTTYKKRRSSGL